MRKNHIDGKCLACEIVAFINSNPFAQVKINAKMLCKEKKKQRYKNGQISDNKKENPLKIKGFSCISSMRKRRLEPCAASETLIERGFPHIIMPR